MTCRHTFSIAHAPAVSWYAFGTVFTIRALEWFIAISMCILAIQTLQEFRER